MTTASYQPDTMEESAGRPPHSKGWVAALVVGTAVTLAVFVYLWTAHDLPGFAWLLPLVWVPLMAWNYYTLRRGQVMGLAMVIFASTGTFLLTTMAVFSQAGETAGLVVGMTGFLVFAAMLTAGAYMLDLVARSEEQAARDWSAR